MLDLILDFERVNELTAHSNDNPTAFNGAFVFSKSRKVLGDMIEIYVNYHDIEKNPSRKKASPEVYDLVVKTLYHNRILVSIREEKINKFIG